jgi:hypothetical protein
VAVNSTRVATNTAATGRVRNDAMSLMCMAITVSDALRLRLLSRPLSGGRGGYAPDPISEKKKGKNKSNGKTFLFLLSLSRRQKINT